jgi:hypothetical protein
VARLTAAAGSRRDNNRERRLSDEFSDTDDSDDGRSSRRIERARRFETQVAMLSFSVPTSPRVATGDGDPTDGFGYRALTTPEAPDDIVSTKKGSRFFGYRR